MNDGDEAPSGASPLCEAHPVWFGVLLFLGVAVTVFLVIILLHQASAPSPVLPANVTGVLQ